MILTGDIAYGDEVAHFEAAQASVSCNKRNELVLIEDASQPASHVRERSHQDRSECRRGVASRDGTRGGYPGS